MINADWLLDDMLNDVRPDFSDITKYDLNGDGKITAADCPFEPGSAKAQLWWNHVMIPYMKSQATPEMKAKYGDKVVGAYKGKALVPGEMGKDQGDFSWLVDRLVITRGYSPEVAAKIAGKVNKSLYGIDGE